MNQMYLQKINTMKMIFIVVLKRIVSMVCFSSTIIQRLTAMHLQRELTLDYLFYLLISVHLKKELVIFQIDYKNDSSELPIAESLETSTSC